MTTNLAAASGTTSIAALGTTATNEYTWAPTTEPADAGVSVAVKSDGPAPAGVLTRGQNLTTSSPSYLAAYVYSGTQKVTLVQVQNGVATTLASLSVPTEVFGPWVTVTLQPTGGTATVQIQRGDTGAYLNAQGQWQTAAANALQANVVSTTANGSVGIARGAGGQGMEFFDSFAVTAPPTQVIQESFDTTKTGSLPTGWAGWTNDGTAGFVAAPPAPPATAPSGPNALVAAGTSVTAARAWYATSQPADVQVSASVLTTTLIPAAVMARGANLNTATPTYYAVQIARGLNVQIVKVVNGVQTTLASINSNSYVSGVWINVTLTVIGNQLSAVVSRPDTGMWLSPTGDWLTTPEPALTATDTGITAGGFVGVSRGGRVDASPLAFDNFVARPASLITPPAVAVTSSEAVASVTGVNTFSATGGASAQRVEFWLDGSLQSASATLPTSWSVDTTNLTNGSHQLVVKAIDSAGDVGTATLNFTVNNPPSVALPARPTLPNKLPSISIAQLAYAGTPMTASTLSLIQNDVDLVIPNPTYLSAINAAAPTTPQLIYTNVSNLYGGLLTSWLSYAYANNISPESAFYHVSAPTPYSGSSPSSQPVNWFWEVYSGPASGAGTTTDLTSAAHGGATTGEPFGAAGSAMTIGYPEPFRELDVTLSKPASAGWQVTYQYPALGADGKTIVWKSLTLDTNNTNGLTQSGQITFDPPSDWVPTVLPGNSAALYYIRAVTTAGTAAQAPIAATLLGSDYTGANGGTSGTIPAFDYAADTNHDGYLDDAEYANRAPGDNARFVYQTRLFYPSYGSMRFVTDPSSPAVQAWAAAFSVQDLAANPLADGLFIDNASGSLPFSGTSVIESTVSYSQDSANLVAAVVRAVAPKIVITNTSGGGASSVPTAKVSTGVLEESFLRPMSATWAAVDDAANVVAQELGSDNPPPYVILDSSPGSFATTDPRLQEATLAYYYLLADPQKTMLMLYGGANPAADWSQTWIPAVTTNVGTPLGAMSVYATGQDPENPALTYQVFGRQYTNALVLYKPLSYTLGVGTGTLDNATATTINLGGNYRELNSDGTLGPIITSISLRNGEGAVLMKA